MGLDLHLKGYKGTTGLIILSQRRKLASIYRHRINGIDTVVGLMGRPSRIELNPAGL
jgi:hypothetical protein